MTTARAGEVGLNEQRVRVAVHSDLAYAQAVAGGLSFRPQFLPAAAEESHEAGRQGLLEGLFIHMPEHKHLAAPLVLNYRRDQTVLEFNAHCRALRKLKMKKPADLSCQRAGSFSKLGCCSSRRPLTRHPEAKVAMVMCQCAQHSEEAKTTTRGAGGQPPFYKSGGGSARAARLEVLVPP